MIAVQHEGTGEIQIVDTIEGYGPEWTVLPAIPDEDPAIAEAALVAAVKARAAELAVAVVTPTPAKAVIYAAKRAELASGTAGAATPSAFPYARADAAAHGDTLDDAVARFAAGAAAADARLAVVEATEQAGIARIRAAVSAAAKHAAAAAIDWSTA